MARRVPTASRRFGQLLALLIVALTAGLTACGDANLARPLSTSAAAAPLPQIGGLFGTGQGVKPAQVQFSADMSENASSVRWVEYDQQQATAYAVMNLNDCTPSCYNGHWQQRPVRLHFYDNKAGRLTVGEVFYLDGTTNLFGRSQETWNFG